MASGPPIETTKPMIVLVHGVFATGDIWRSVEARLRQDGYRTKAVTLPGRPGNPLPSPEVTLARYRDVVLAAIATELQPVVLVGHSFGGITISNVGEAASEKIKALVYIAAHLPVDGQSLLSLFKTDPSSRVQPAFRVSEDKTTASIDPDRAGGLFCNGCPASVQTAFAAEMVHEPRGPLAESVSLTPERFGRIPKAYVHTSRDLVVSPALQAAMTAATPVRQAITLRTGHAAPLVFSAEIAKAIGRAAR